MRQKVFIIEYAKGSDKSFDGFRADSKPILTAIEEATQRQTEIVFYNPDKKEMLFDYLVDHAHSVISRINPGNLKEVDDYFVFLKGLGDCGVKVFTHPDVMINLDFKDILYKLKGTSLGEESTEFYQSYEHFKTHFPQVLRHEHIRVLKTNYGSTGEGVYLVRLCNNGTVESVEAVNNEKQCFGSLEDFLEDFQYKFEKDDKNAEYFHGKSGFVSCRYLKRINEGEIRVLLVNDKPIAVVHKKPQEGEFSATLFSGAKYLYESPTLPKYHDVITLTMKGLDEVKSFCNNKDLPLLWTMDYILDWNEKGEDCYVLSEINCSCVGISTNLEYAPEVARVFKENISHVHEKPKFIFQNRKV